MEINIALSNFKKEDLSESYLQSTGKIKLLWDNLPVGAKILLHYRNGCYVGVHRIGSSAFEVTYTSKIITTNTGETTFENLSESKEESVVVFESVKQI